MDEHLENLMSNLDSPVLRVSFDVFSAIALSVLSSSITSEITENAIPQWSKMPSSRSFLPLVGIFVVMLLFQWYRYRRESTLQNFKTAAGARAYMRKMCLPAVAKEMQKKIKSGENPEDFKDMRKILGI